MTDKSDETRDAGDRLILQRAFIVVLALGISAVFLWMIRDFLSVLFLAAVLALLLMPVQQNLARLLGGRARIAASLVMVLTAVVILLPVSAMLFLIARQAVEVTQAITPWLQDQVAAWRQDGVGALPGWMPFQDVIITYQGELTSQLGDLASRAGTMIVSALRSATGNVFALFLHVIVLIFALYLFLMSGRTMAANTINLIPMAPKDRELLAERALSTIRATVKGTFVIAVVQGVLTGIALAICGIPGAAFWGGVAGVLSIVPLVGPPLVWGPAALFLWFDGQIAASIGLALYGSLFVGVIDNVLRPILVGQDTKMPDLLILISTVGGLTLFGPVGLIIGPVIAALFISVWYIYAQSYAPLLNEDRGEPPLVSSAETEADRAIGGRVDDTDRRTP